MVQQQAKAIKKEQKTEIKTSLKFEVFNFKSRFFWISTALVFVFSFLIYSNTINHDYALDDTGAIQQNLNVKKGLQGIPDILKMDLWEQSEVRLGYYRPLSLITFALEYHFFQSAPHVCHFNNVLLFAISCVVLLFVLQALLGNVHQFIPLAITILFAAHPIHTEVVANIKSRDEILSFLFVFSSILFFIFNLQKKKPIFLIISFICAYLGMLSKETALTGLLMIPIIYFLYSEEKLKVLKLFPVIAAIGIFFLQKSIFIKNVMIPVDIINYPYDQDFKLPTSIYLFVLGLKLLIIPINLRYDYSYNLIPAVDFNNPMTFLGVIILIGGGVFTLNRLLKKSILAVPLSMYFFAIAPGFAFTFLRGGIFAERFLYSAALGFLMFLILILFNILKRWSDQVKNIQLFGIGAFTILLTSMYSTKTFTRNFVWRDNYTLFSTDIKTGENSAQNQRHFAEQTLVKAMEEKDSTRKIELANVSLKAFEKSYTMHPRFAESYMKTAVIYQLILNKPDTAIYFYRKTIECEPTKILQAEAFYNLGTVYQNNKANLVYASYCYNQSLNFKSDYAPAISATEALKKMGINTLLEPTGNSFDENSANRDANYYFNLGYKRASEGKYKDAIVAFQEALNMNPNNIDALLNLGNCHGMLGNYQKSIEYNDKIISLNPNEERAYRNNAINYEKLGNLELSKQFLDKANALNSKVNLPQKNP
ncbi:MAG: tetratricopeptide repeat protein [Bacteroidetes bacterium]|nr:tetratricopeptide repeat protein [Bacteroidota bacterium]